MRWGPDPPPPQAPCLRVFAMVPSSHELRVSRPFVLVAAIVVILVASLGIVGASGPDGRVQGFVTDSGSAAPISGAVVRIEASDLPWAFETTTDAAGYFEVAVPPHRYDLSARSSAHLGNVTSIAVGSGQTTWANLTLASAGSRSARLQGYVTDITSGSPVTSGRILAGPPWWSFSGRYVNASGLNASGYYEMDLVPDSYEVSTDGVIGYDPFSYYPVSLGTGQVRWYNISLDPNPVNAWINGTVRDADTSASIAGAEITARVDGLLLPPVASNASGFYSLPVPSGTVEITADAIGYAPMSTSVFVWGAGNFVANLDLPPLSYAVRGYVLDGVTGAPIPGAVVTVDPLFRDGYFDQATTNASGYYDISLPQDDFIASTSAPGYTSWTIFILFFSGPVVWANVTLWPIVSTVAGNLVDAVNGSRVPGLVVTAIDVRSGYVTSTTADAFGSFSLDVPPSPAMSVAAYGQPPYAGNIVYVETRPYETTWVDIPLERLNAQIRANITDALTGLPVSGVSLSAGWYYGSGWAISNATGAAVFDAPAGVDVYLTAIASGYDFWMSVIVPVAGVNEISVVLYPDLPQDVRVRGYVLDASTGLGLWSVTVEATGYGRLTPDDRTNSSGYYELRIVAAPQTIRAAERGYTAAEASVDPSPGETIWINFTLTPDADAPRVRNFTATPSVGVAESNPTTLLADVNESSLDLAYLSILMLHSTSGGIGTFLSTGRFDDADVSVSTPSANSYEISASWDTRTRIARLSDGITSLWWPAPLVLAPFLGVVNGYYDDGILPTPLTASAVFDVRDGRLLYVMTSSGFVSPRDAPLSTFSPYAFGVRIDLGTAGIVGSAIVTAPALRIGSLQITLADSVPFGQYAAYLELWDAAGSYSQAAVLLQTEADTVPPVASAGADATVDEDTVMTFDGSGSTDNVGIASYTWTFTDGTPQVLLGATATYTFAEPGTYVVTLTVEDADGNVGTDTFTVTVRDVTAPTVSISAPSEGASLSGSVLLDGASVGNDTAPPFELLVPAGSLGIGNRTIEVVAYDGAGHSASDRRNVTVSSAAPGAPAGLDILFVGGLGLLVVAAVAAAVLILMRRRKPRLPSAAPPLSDPSSAPPVPEADAEQTPAIPLPEEAEFQGFGPGSSGP